MKIYETSDGVDEYIKMCDGFDNSQFKEIILKYLSTGKSLLEIGSGPGNDYGWLSELYKVTASDYSKEFLSRLKLRFPHADLLELDAVSLITDVHYDSIFSSKVFQHFNYQNLENSLKKQYYILNNNGIICHFFWIGCKEFDMEDMHFIYFDKMRLEILY